MKKIMRKNLHLIFLICFAALNLQAQSMREPYSNVDAGWKKKIVFNTPPKTMTVDDRNYSVKQVGDAQTMLTWMQETFSPKGMLGDAKWYLNPTAKSEPVTSKYFGLDEAAKRNRTALPHLWGAYSKFNVFLKKDASGKYVEETPHEIRWNIEVNGLENFSYQISAISTPEEYYFLMPRYEIGMRGLMESDYSKNAANFRNFTNHPNLKKYDHYYVPSRTLSPGSNDYYVVIMTKDQKPLPFEHVTIGDFIKQLEKQFPLMLYMKANERDNPKFKEQAEKGFQIFKDRFAAKANEKVYLQKGIQLDILFFSNADEKSTFRWLQTTAIEKETGYSYFPLLKTGKRVKEASMNGEAQWLFMRWEPPMSKTLAGDVHYMDSMLNRFNYDYVHNYFFGKRPTEPYKPLNY